MYTHVLHFRKVFFFILDKKYYLEVIKNLKISYYLPIILNLAFKFLIFNCYIFYLIFF